MVVFDDEFEQEENKMNINSNSSIKKKKRGVRMSVDFGRPSECTSFKHLRKHSEGDVRPSIVILDDCGTDITLAESGKFSFSEMDPQLVMAASMFVQELIQRAQLEVANRFGGSDSRDNIEDDFNQEEEEGQMDEEDNLLFGSSSEAGGKGRQKASNKSQNREANLRFIREEINKKCRTMYRAFLSCYGKLP